MARAIITVLGLFGLSVSAPLGQIQLSTDHHEIWVAAGLLHAYAALNLILSALIHLHGPQVLIAVESGSSVWARVPPDPAQARVLQVQLAYGCVLAGLAWLVLHGALGLPTAVASSGLGACVAFRFAEVRTPGHDSSDMTGKQIIATWQIVAAHRRRWTVLLCGRRAEDLENQLLADTRERGRMSFAALVTIVCFGGSLALSGLSWAVDGSEAPRAPSPQAAESSANRVEAPEGSSKTQARAEEPRPEEPGTVCDPIDPKLVDDDPARLAFQRAFDGEDRAVVGCPTALDSNGTSRGVAVMLGTCPTGPAYRSAVVLTAGGMTTVVYSGDRTATDPVEVVRALNAEGVLRAASARTPVRNGDLYAFATTRGTEILVRANKVSGPGMKSKPVNCSDVHPGGGRYERVTAGAASLWLAAVRAGGRALWPQEQHSGAAPGTGDLVLVDGAGGVVATLSCEVPAPRSCQLNFPGSAVDGTRADDASPVLSAEGIRSLMEGVVE